MRKIMTITETELSYTKKLLIKLYLLQKFFILDTYFFFNLIMQQVTLFT